MAAAREEYNETIASNMTLNSKSFFIMIFGLEGRSVPAEN